MRTLLGTATIVLLAGCKTEFYGDRGDIGFNTSLQAGDDPWTPDLAVASGSPMIVFPTCVADETEESGYDCDPDIDWSMKIRGSLGSFDVEDGILEGVRGVVGGAGDRGRVVFEGGGVKDAFHVRYVEPVDATIRPVGGQAIGDVAWEIVEGQPTTFAVDLLDEAGLRLGYAGEQVWVEATTALTATWNDEVIEISGDEAYRDGVVTIGYGDVVMGTIDLVVVPANLPVEDLH